MEKILILGAYGLLGTYISKGLKEKGFDIYQQGRLPNSEYKCNPTDFLELSDLVFNLKPQIVINLIANTSVENCEINSENAYNSNVKVLENLYKISINNSFYLIHISTDQVYSGTGPHKEEDVNPCNVYGITKYAAELIAEKTNSTILRTNFVCKSFIPNRESYTDWVVSSFKGDKPFTIYNDVLFNALYVEDLINALLKVIEKKHKGVFNLGCIDGISKADFALELSKKLKLESNFVNIGSISNNKIKVKRPLDMRMDVSKFIKTFQHELPSMSNTIDKLVSDYI